MPDGQGCLEPAGLSWDPEVSDFFFLFFFSPPSALGASEKPVRSAERERVGEEEELRKGKDGELQEQRGESSIFVLLLAGDGEPNLLRPAGGGGRARRAALLSRCL